MMKKSISVGCCSRRGGFTLLEVLVSLILGSMIVGGLMGLISLSLHYQHRLKIKSQIQPLLEAAAEEILADPQKAAAGSLTMGTGIDAPKVSIRLTRMELSEPHAPAPHPGALYRVLMECRGQVLEFSLYLPPAGALEGSGISDRSDE
jgi:prepilin-type N-terminal cleavage/methylation domain-containing protein